MTTSDRAFPRPRTAVVVGAGMVGLSTALLLARGGLQVTVVEADRVAAGASWGNAGWLTPPLATPLPEPALLAYGLRALASPDSAVHVPLRPDPDLLRFLTGFARRSTTRSWRRAMSSYAAVNRLALDAFDDLADAGVAEPTISADDFLVGFTDAAGRQAMEQELAAIHAAGQPVEAEPVSLSQARTLAPALADGVVAVLRLGGTRYLNPPRYLEALSRAAHAAGVDIRERATAVAVEGGAPHRAAAVRLRRTPDRPQGTRSRYGEDRLAPGGPATAIASRSDGRGAHGDTERLPGDVVVLATGAWLGDLARPFGVRMLVQAGRGYSFSVPADPPPTTPLYFPAQRLACTPLDGRLRVAGMMELRRPGDRLDPRRIAAMVGAARPLLRGVDLTDRRDEWVGSRPVTPDGLPLVGPTRSPRVVAAGGHGMWGITLGPLTARLVTDLVTTGRRPAELVPFDPLR